MAGTCCWEDNPSSRRYGPISYGGALWAFPLTELGYPPPNPDLQLGVYKSTDGGKTWLRQDLADAPSGDQNGPLNDGQNTGVVFANSWWDGSSSKVTIVYVYADLSCQSAFCFTRLSLVDFDMSTGTFGTPYATRSFFTGPAGAAVCGWAWTEAFSLFKLSSGNFRFVWREEYYCDDGSGFQSQLYFADYSPASGTWSSLNLFPNNVVAWGVQYFVYSTLQDADVIHAMYSNFDMSTNTWEYWYVQISASGSFSSPINLNISGTLGFPSGTGVVSGDAILIPLTGSFGAGVLRGTPKSSPTFALIPAGGFSPLPLQMLHQPVADVLMWGDENPATLDQSLLYLSTSADSGLTWSPPLLIMSLDATPPTTYPGVDTVDIDSISLGLNLNGSLGFVITTELASYLGP